MAYFSSFFNDYTNWDKTGITGLGDNSTFMGRKINRVSLVSNRPMTLNYCIDVDENLLTNNDVLNYDTSDAKWKNKSLPNIGVSNYNNADGGYYYETYTGMLGNVDGGIP